MTVVIAVANQKGGVGKTTTAVTLAHALAAKNQQTLLIDLDPQGQAALALGVDVEPGVFEWLSGKKPRPLGQIARKAREKLYIVPGDDQTAEVQILMYSRGWPLDHLLTVLKPYFTRGLKYVVFDTGPSVGGLQERALYTADLVIVPTSCTFLAADGVAKTMATIYVNQQYGWHGSLLGVLPTFYDERTNESRQTLDQLCHTYPNQVLPAIHTATILADCAAEGLTIWEKDGSSRAAQEYAEILYKILEVS